MPSTTQQRSRKLDVPGTTNFRDLGGYETTDGRRVKWGLVYRSDSLSGVAAGTAKTVLQDRLRVHNAFDLRKPGELADKPYDFAGITHHVVSSDPSLLSDWAAAGKMFTAQITNDLMMENYRARADDYAAPYETIFRFIVDTVAARELARTAGGEGSLPLPTREAVVFHCTAGKDRTGWMAALLLHILGVPFPTILADFELTREFLVRPGDAVNYLGGLGMDAASRDVLWGIDPRWLTGAFAYCEERYGGVEAYIRAKLNLTAADLATLRDVLLE